MERCAILLADAVARKRTTLFLGLVQGKATRSKVEKGELVVSDSCVSDYKCALYYLENDQAVMLCTENGIEVAFLTDHEVMLLKAIASPLTRYEVYSSGKCTWGQGLHLHDAVSVFIPLMQVLASAIICYIGKIDGFPGTMFGVEITDRQYASCGNTTGMWQGKRVFHCKSKCNTALFASLDMISKLREGSIQTNASNILGEEKTSVSQQPSQVCGLGALEPPRTSDSLSAQENVPQSIVQPSPSTLNRKLYEEKEQECSLAEQSQAKQHLEQQCSLKQQLSQQSQASQKIQEGQDCQLQKVNEEHQQRILLIQEEQHLLHEEKDHLQGECTALQQQVVQQREAAAQAEQQCSLLKQQLSQQSQASQKIQQEYSELERQLQEVREQHEQEKKRILLIQEEQHLLHEEKHRLQGECTALQQQVDQQREAAVQAEIRYRQEIEQLQRRLAEMQQLHPSSVLMDINVSRNEVQIFGEIDRGAWGYVAKGRFRGQLVAVKSPHPNILNRQTTERLQREVRIMTQVRHPNLLRIIAAVFDNQVPHLPPLIVTELLDMNLRAAYKNNRLSEASRIPIFRDVAYALHYLHEHQEPIIHRDVSAPNVLLEVLPNGIFRAKVSDFGSANLAKLAQTLAEGAIIYAAPETFPHDLHSPPPPQTTKIDVYSYGVLLCEVITCQLPDPQSFLSMLQEVKSKWSFMHDLIVSCTHRSPEGRLTMAQVLDKLNQLPHAQPH